MSSNLATPTNNNQALASNSAGFENGSSCDASQIGRLSEVNPPAEASRIGWGAFANLIEDVAACADTDAWVELAKVLRTVLPVEARAAISWSTLRSLDTCEQAEMVAEAVLRFAEYPLPTFLSPMRDACFWASHVNRRELKAYANAAFQTLSSDDQAAFLRHVQEQETAA